MFTLLGLAAQSESGVGSPRSRSKSHDEERVTMQVSMSDGCITPNTPPLLRDASCFFYSLCVSAKVLHTHTYTHTDKHTHTPPVCHTLCNISKIIPLLCFVSVNNNV